MIFNNDECFYRRIFPVQFDYEKQEISISAFGDPRLSVNLARLSSIEKTINGYIGDGVASITAKNCYDLNQEIESTPTAENPSHCEVVGQKSKSVKRALRNAAILLVTPSKPNKDKLD